MSSVSAINGGLSPSKLPPLEIIFGQSSKMATMRQRIERVAQSNIPVLLQGESGTGKDIVARLIHELSPWRKGPFVRVTCPSIPDTLVESELFGYERGSFTGAIGAKAGRVEVAEGGTLFLDEISELNMTLQSKLLQVLQDGSFSKLGSTSETKVDVRLVCATNRSLSDEIETGGFREDVFYRINGVTIDLPSLRERLNDIPMLVEYFIQVYSYAYNNRCKSLSAETLAQMQQYWWPGNIRELENLVKRYVILGDEEAVRIELIPKAQAPFALNLELDKPVPLKRITRNAVRELERKIILAILEKNDWNRKRTAKALSISYRALLYKIREIGVPSKRLPPFAVAASAGFGSMNKNQIED